MVMTIEPDGTRHAADSPAADEADVQEQQRPAQDDGVDPEQVAEDVVPDGTRIDADAADVQDQSMDVTEEDE